MRKKSLLSTIIALGLTTGAGSASAQDSEIFMIEEDPITVTDIDQDSTTSIPQLERLARKHFREGNKAAAEAAFKRIAAIAQERAKAPNATADTIFLAAGNLNKIAHFYAPANSDFMPEKQMAQILPPGTPTSPAGVSKENFKLGESYRLQAMAILDRLPPTNSHRIYAQRALTYFYRYYGQAEAERLQTQKLSAMLNTTDPNQLFPFRRPCYGCGRG